MFRENGECSSVVVLMVVELVEGTIIYEQDERNKWKLFLETAFFCFCLWLGFLRVKIVYRAVVVKMCACVCVYCVWLGKKEGKVFRIPLLF